MNAKDLKSKILGGFYGAAVGDALGVPVEFASRKSLQKDPVKDLRGYGCWNQPPGTFSDDSSMMFCTAESLCQGLDLNDMAKRFTDWYQHGYWGAHNEVFDIGGTTRRSLSRVIKGTDPKLSGEFFEENNGNGSLMRILPLVYFLSGESDIKTRYQVIKAVSSITHAHFRSVFSCYIYVELGIQLLQENFETAYANMQSIVNGFIDQNDFNPEEIALFNRILKQQIWLLPESAISSMGYVLDSLEASFWSIGKYPTYAEATLKAVNLGGDTDTTAAITGGLAGIIYGEQGIGKEWINKLAKTNKIRDLAIRFDLCMSLMP